jgi:hypothetical protein
VFPGLIVSYLLLKHVGRKVILFYGVIAAFFANIIIGIGFYVRDYTIAGNAFLYIGIFTYIMAYGVSLGPVIILYIPEIV